MPIIVNQNSNPNTLSPKYFSSLFTGDGLNSGLINQMENIALKDVDQHKRTNSDVLKKSTITQGDSKITKIPIHPLSSHMISVDSVHIDRNDLIFIDKDENKRKEYKGLAIKVEILNIEHTSKPRYVNTTYIMKIYNIKDNNLLAHQTNANLEKNSKNTVRTFITLDPKEDLPKAINSLNLEYDKNLLDEYINNYSLYDELVNQATKWNDINLADVLSRDIIYLENKKLPYSNEVIIEQIKYLINYKLPLETYTKLYNNLLNNIRQNNLNKYIRHNLNLLLNDTLENLKQNKNTINQIPHFNNTTLPNYYSIEQQNAIITEEPLVIVQATAGSGKSTVILERVQHMIKAGIDPTDIMVLSFTNVAADNIMNKNKDIKAMTIAKMIHLIYSENFKEHQLSTLPTIINAIDIYYSNNNNIAQTFKKLLRNIQFNSKQAFTEANNFIDDHYDEVIEILNTIGQTSLELEIMICYNKIDELIEPDSIKSKYIIIDETQDNSVFEFIYAIRYVEKHQESLYIVGDSAQTLYEFRASDPTALNMLESSGVFATYKLSTNFRSNQEILDFANVLLENIEANRFAKMQMKANSLDPVTKKSFTDKVTLNYETYSSDKAFIKDLPQLMQIELKKYIDSKLKLGENVAILASNKNYLIPLEKQLDILYKNQTIVNLRPKKPYSSTVFSMFIKKYWSQIQFVPNISIQYVIKTMMENNIEALTGKKHADIWPLISEIYDDYYTKNNKIINAYIKQFNLGNITKIELLDMIKETMLTYEIENNAIRQSMVNQKNQNNKALLDEINPNIIISTVHSAKGLEFDNVIIVYKDDKMMNEENKRMYYVAFTRAMKSEYILAYGNTKSSKIQTDYDSIVDNL